MFEVTEQIPLEELTLRRERCLRRLAAQHPEAGGLLVFSRPAIYYFTGLMIAGVLWLPREGQPLLMVRKGLERAALDSPHTATVLYRSYTELVSLASEHGAPFTPVIAAEQNSLPWSLADTLQRRLPGVSFVSGDTALSRARAVKTPFELDIMREGGRRHAKGMEEMLPQRISPGMTELEVALEAMAVFFSLGSLGISRLNAFGEELYLGKVSIGNDGNYPSAFNGPLGGKGAHPSLPNLGSPDTVWKEGSTLIADVGFNHKGYLSDKTLCYFAGNKGDIPPKVQKAHDVCMAIEQAVAERLKPGVLPHELYSLAVDMAGKAGFADGFMGAGANQVSFLGHGIGLCVDEWPVLAPRFANPLETGMVVAVEPKIGLHGIAMIGSENIWEVTESGGCCLSGGIRDIICIE
ncbi:MAG: Xaa-Pro peptidase family protein [Desulfovibrionaceae bacterium]|nr:Xaa-Pro peptidase family protein [Desulfovibrionaceae bacterium]